MGNFFRSLLFGESEETEETKAKRNFDVLKYDGIRAMQIGKIEYAIRCFSEALKLEEDIETLEYLIGACTRADHSEDAIEAASRLVVLKPEDAAPMLVRANLYFMNEQYPEAIADCRNATTLDASNAQGFYLMARAQKVSDDKLGAVISLSQAIALKDDYMEAHLLRAEVMLEMGDYKKGLEDAVKVVEMVPEEEHAYLVRGQLYEAVGDSKSAEDDYCYVTELNPFNEQSYLYLGNLYINRQQPERAIELFDEAIELRPDFAKAYCERGRARLMKGDKPGSIEDAKKALELDPHSSGMKGDGTYSNFGDMYSNRVL